MCVVLFLSLEFESRIEVEMADNEKSKKYNPSRRNPQHTRPHPGVQKAIQTLGVRDLREILDKKREQGDSQGDKHPEHKLTKPPPPDPSYNYLKDPTRDKPKSPAPRKKDFENSNKVRHKDERSSRQQPNRDHESIISLQNNKENCIVQEKGVLKKQGSPQSEGAPKKELRFDENPKIAEIPPITRRHSFRGRNARRGGGVSKEVKEQKIENPFNIKIELSTETGLRNCTLDENTKIADIKHVPNKIPHQRSPRGGFRGSRGGFRGRGRGRGIFRGRGGFSLQRKETELKENNPSHGNSFKMDELKKNLDENLDEEHKYIHEKESNQNRPSDANLFEKNANIVGESNEEYDNENEEYNDANETYDDEFSSEYLDDKEHDENFNHDQKLVSQSEGNLLDSNLKETITITSSKFQDGEVQRSIEVKANSNVTRDESTLDNANDNKE